MKTITVIAAGFSTAGKAMGDLVDEGILKKDYSGTCLLYTSPSPRDLSTSRMPSSA